MASRSTGVTEAERCIVKPNTMHLTEVQSLSKQKPIDIAFVSVKSYDTEWATMLISSYLAADGYVVSLQNCINEERIAGIVGWGQNARLHCGASSGGSLRAGTNSAHQPEGQRHATAIPSSTSARYTAVPRGARRNSPKCSAASTR